MNNNIKYALCAGIFLLCVGIGFLATRLGKDDVKEQVSVNSVNKPTESVVTSSPDAIADSQKIEVDVPELSSNSDPIRLVSKVVKKVGNYYTLTLVCANIPKDVLIIYEIPALKLSNANGKFTKIPGSKSGSYLVNIINSKTKEVLLSESVSGFVQIEEAKIEKMTAAQFQALLLNQNDNSLLGGKNPKIAKSVALSFTDLKEGEKRPNDILAVREKIAFGIWSSARVVRVGYDESGRINSATIQPVY